MKRKRTKYNIKFDRIVFNNRWKLPFYSRSGTWVIIGFGKRYFDPLQFEYYINFFGFDLKLWLTRELKYQKTVKVNLSKWANDWLNMNK